MNEKSRQNLGEVLARMGDPRRAADGLRTDRDRLCRIIRAARVSIRAKREKEYSDYCEGRIGDPRD
jgi:hypothetical protein